MRKKREFTEDEVAYALNQVYDKENSVECKECSTCKQEDVVSLINENATAKIDGIDYYFLEIKRTALEYAFRVNNGADAKQLVKDANKIEEFLIN